MDRPALAAFEPDIPVMTRLAFAASLVLATLFPIEGRASPIAEVLCAPEHQMRHRLEANYGAQRAWNGLRGPDQVLELWEDRNGDWTLIAAYANGKWCILAMGTALAGYQDLPQG